MTLRRDKRNEEEEGRARAEREAEEARRQAEREAEEQVSKWADIDALIGAIHRIRQENRFIREMDAAMRRRTDG